MNFNANKQTLVEFAEHIATTKSNAKRRMDNFYIIYLQAVVNPR